jgi:hypothetical protein
MDEVVPGFTGIITQKVGAVRNIMRGFKKTAREKSWFKEQSS